MDGVSKRLNLQRKMTNALEAERPPHRVTFNPVKASLGETLRVLVPKLDVEVVLVPGLLSLFSTS